MPRNANDAPQNDASSLLGMIACFSFAGALGGAIGTARVEKLSLPAGTLVAAFGLLIGISSAWAVWRVGARVLPGILARRAGESLPWNQVLPMMYLMVIASLVASGFVGAALTHLAIQVGRQWLP